jgi:DNA segregation ATPase FtsK/SpoIIIE-like protein
MGASGSSTPSGGRPASPSPSRPDDRSKSAASGSGGITDKVGGLFGRGDKKADKPATPKSAVPGRSAGAKDDKKGGMLGRFGLGKDDKNSKSTSPASMSSASPMGGSSARPYGSSGPGAPASSGSAGSARPGSSYSNAPSGGGRSGSPARTAAKTGGVLAGLSRLNPFAPREESRTARTARSGPAVEVKPVSFARDKQLEIAGMIMAIAGIVLILSSLSPVQGSIPQQINGLLSRMFGWGAIVVPIAMVPLGVWLILIKVGQNTPVIALSRIIGLVLLFFSALVLMQFIDALSYPPGQNQTYNDYLIALERVLLPLSSEFGRGGGMVGGQIYFQLIRNFSEPGGFVILLGVLIVGLMLTLSVSAYEIAAIVIGSGRNLRDAYRRRATRLAAERAAAQSVTVSTPARPAIPAPDAATSPALPASTGTQPLPLEAGSAPERNIPILMGGRPLAPAADSDPAAPKSAVPFPPLAATPSDGEPVAAAEKAAPAAKPAGMFGRLKTALPAVGAATVLAAKSTVSAITPDKEPREKDGAAPPGEAVNASASAAPGTAAPAPPVKPSTPGAGGLSNANPSAQAKAGPVKPSPLSGEDEDDPLGLLDDEFEDDEDEGSPPPRLGDLLRPPAEPAKPAVSAAPAGAASDVKPFTPPPLAPATRTVSASGLSGDAPAPKPAAETTASAAAAEHKPTNTAESTSAPATEALRKPSAPIIDDDWSSLPPARPRGAADKDRPAAAASTPDKEPPDLHERLAALRGPAPAKPAEPAMAPPANAPRPWEASNSTAANGKPAASASAAENRDEHSGAGVKAGAAAVLGGMAGATLNALRSPAPPPPPKAADAHRPATSPPRPAPAASAPPQRSSASRASWRLPDFTGLLAAGADQEMNHDKLLARARMIEDTLASFGAPGRVVEVRTGPVITQFGVEPDYVETRGKKNRVKVSAIANLDKDLQLALGAKSIRIEAPVPGKGYVGIEVPNEKPAIVRLRDVMESNEFRRIQSPLAIALGMSVDGTPVAADLGTMPHLLIAGTTGSGKSVAVNTIIASLLLRNPPDQLKFIMVDPKRVELTGYNGIPHLVAPVVVELERVVSVLKWVTREMDERYRKFALAGARNIEDFNNHLPANEPIMPYIVVIIDELADLMMMAPDDTEKVITRIAALARATGIHLVIATQRPSVDVVTGLIKANFPARIAFAVSAGVDSRVILDQPGAERLLGRGDMLFMSGDTPAPARLQGVYVSDQEIGNITRFWRNQLGDAANAEAAKPILSDFRLDEEARQNAAPAARGSGIGYGSSGRPGGPSRGSFDDDLDDDEDGEADDNPDSDDALYEQAVETVRRLNKASVSLLQRRLRIGYTRAARIIDMMEARGVIGPAVEGAKPRDVLPPNPGRPT